MGQAFHRKASVSLGRGTKTSGIGIKYYSNPAPHRRVLTAEEAAERNRLKEASKTPRGVREWNVYCLTTIAAFALDDWEDSVLAQIAVEEDPMTERTVDRALKVVNSVVNKHCDRTGIEVDTLLDSLQNPRNKYNNDRPETKAALGFVRDKFLSVFDKVQTMGKAVSSQ